MDISFLNDDLKTICEQERQAVKRLGTPCAKKLKARLADMRDADSVSELVAGRPHPLSGDRAGQFALELHGGKRLAFESADEPVPTTPDGATNWPAVTKARIVYIGDYHD